MTRPLRTGELTAGDQVVGLYLWAGPAAPTGADVVTVRTLRSGPGLVVPPAAGAEVDDADLAARLGRDLSALVGETWAIGPDRLQLVDGMMDPARRRESGVRSDAGPLAWLAVEHDGWICQAVASSAGAAVALIKLLRPDQALDGPDLPAVRPLGDVGDLVAALAPGVNVGMDHTSQAPPNVYDAVLTGPRASVRAGVRRRLGPDHDPLADELGYCYVLRVDSPAVET